MKKLLFLSILLCINAVKTLAFDYTDKNGVTWTCSTYSDDAVFLDGTSNCDDEVIIPDIVYDGDKAYTIYALRGAFKNNQTLRKVILSKTVKGLYSSAFEGCKGLVAVENTEYIDYVGDNVFYGCVSLTTINFPSVTHIGGDAFYGCSSLTDISIPLVKEVGSQAFSNCSSLKDIELPLITTINHWTFGNCSNLTSVKVPSITEVATDAFYNCSSLKEVIGLENVITIKSSAFCGCSSLESVNLLKVVSVGDNAFNGTLITNVSLPATLQSLGAGNFCNAAKVVLASTTPPVLTDGFGDHAFSSFTTFLVPETSLEVYRNADVWKQYASQMLSLSDVVDYDVTTTAQENTSGLYNVIGEDKLAKVVTLKVKGTINGYDIMIMHNKMPNLHWLDLSEANIVANPYEYYTRCHTEDNVVGKYAFVNLGKLISIKLPNSATAIGRYAFEGCVNLKETVLPNKVVTIAEYAFYCCKELRKIELPPTLKSIQERAFYGCVSLERIELPGVEVIGMGAFDMSTESIGSKIKSIRIPSTVKSIGDQAFNSSSIKDVYVYTVEPIIIGQNTFANSTYKTATLHIPMQSKNNYYWTSPWNQFANLVEFDEPYKYFYLNKEYTLNDRFTGEPDIDINPGGGIIVPDKPEQGDQDADTIHIKGDGKNWASIIANANLNAKGLYIDISIKANRWYFFSFPFKVRKADISCGKNVKFVFRTYNGAIRAKKGTGGWIDLDSSEEYLEPGKGYIFQASLDCTLSIKIEKSVFGKLPKVDVDTKLNVHTSTNEQNASWNFVGNPFTAFYDINDMGYTSPITRWNSDSKTYEAVRPGDDNAFLNPFEAFFVQCPKDNDDINFGGDNRLTQTGRDKKMNSQMQKARMEGQFDVQRQIVNLTLSDGTTTDKTRVVFNPDKKAGYERDCDAAKFESNGASELYSVEALAGRLAINERPEGSVKIGYRAAKAGEYTIAAQRMDRQVLLRDNDLQITFDLTQGDYHFTSDAGEFDNRFMLLIDNSTTGIGDIVSTTGVNVKPTDCGLNISNLQGKTLHVYALNGALYATRTQDGFLGLAKGVYLVEVEGLKAKFMVR